MDEYYEDVELGDRNAFGEYEVTQEEIIEFAEQYDPQPFHTDPEAAGESWFGGLVASGWHTCAMTMRMIVDEYISESGAMGAVGVEDLQWREPVRPGMTLHVEGEGIEKEPWQPGIGAVGWYSETIADDETTVMSMEATVLFPMRSD